MNKGRQDGTTDGSEFPSGQAAPNTPHLVPRRSFLQTSGVASLSLLFNHAQPLVLAQAHDVIEEAGPWWELEEPLRILDLVTALDYIPALDPAELAAKKASQFYNAEHFDVMGMAGGLDDQEFFFSSKVAGKQNVDYLGKYLPQAKKRGIRVFVYFVVHWFKSSFGDKHPDWRQITEQGGPLKNLYGASATSFCVNTPWREWVFQILRDLCAYPIDGIFFDGPLFFPNTCYCRYCQEKFLKAYGTKLPSKRKRQGKAAHDLLEFQADSILSFLRDSRQVIKSINPKAAFYINGGLRGGNWDSGVMNRRLVPEQDLLGAEGGFIGGDLTRSPIWKASVQARLLETQAPDKPRVVFCSVEYRPWAFSLLPEPELRLLYAGSIANAASVYIGIVGTYAFERPGMEAVAKMNRFVSQNRAHYRGTRSEATTALVWSDNTANFLTWSDTVASGDEDIEAQLANGDQVSARKPGDHDAEFSGLADALIRSQTPFDVIDDVTLEQELSERYATIFLPNVACMSEKAARGLKEYVRRGGSVFATFETSLYDDTGVRQPNFSLSEVFGVSDAGKIVGPNRWDYMQPRTTDPLLAGWPRDLVPAAVYHVSVTPRDGQTLVNFMKPLAGRYVGIPDPSEDPALVVHRYGKGKAIYFSGDLGNSLNFSGIVEFSRLIENVLRDIAPSPVVIENAPRSIEVVLRSQQQGQRLLLHLINFTAEMTRPITRIVPLENVRITLRTKADVKRIHTLMRPETLALRRIDGEQVQFVVPRLEEYEVVVLEE